ncbi:hypothetical protein QUA82_10570 [Microcoleus sp. F8-D3]
MLPATGINLGRSVIVGLECASHHLILRILVELEAAIQKGENSGTKNFYLIKASGCETNSSVREVAAFNFIASGWCVSLDRASNYKAANGTYIFNRLRS